MGVVEGEGWRVSPSAVALWTERALVAIKSNDARPTRTLVRESHSTP